VLEIISYDLLRKILIIVPEDCDELDSHNLAQYSYLSIFCAPLTWVSQKSIVPEIFHLKHYE